MHVRLYNVIVNEDTTRTFTVPAYDVPIIKLNWASEVAKKAHLGQKILVEDTGRFEPRSLYDERHRLETSYHGVPDGESVSAWKVVYPKPTDLELAYNRAVREGTYGFQCAEALRNGTPMPEAPPSTDEASTDAERQLAQERDFERERNKLLEARLERLEALLSKTPVDGEDEGKDDDQRPAKNRGGRPRKSQPALAET